MYTSEEHMRKEYKQQRELIVDSILQAIKNEQNSITIQRYHNCGHLDFMFILSGLQSAKLINVTNSNENIYTLNWLNSEKIFDYLNKSIQYSTLYV